MDFLLSYVIIPGLTLLLPGETNWFTSNFSVAGAYFPQNVLLLVWAIVIARFYHTFTKRTIGQTKSFLNTEKELILTDVSAYLLVGSVLFPYRPQTYPFFSFLHLIMAFSATVIFFLSVTLMTGRLYLLAPDLFSWPIALLIFAIACTFVLLILCDFIISSALEIFLTLFSCAWLQLFDQRIRILSRRKYLRARMR
ncbi:MAG: hypothetical protein E7246_01180 [Lachnoclostridium sp.]|nr:hypothetical protein [Lachnoclostridium sp.]